MQIVNVVLTSSCLDANGVPTWTSTELLGAFLLPDTNSIRGMVALKAFLNVHVFPQFGLDRVRWDRFRELLAQFDLQFHFDHESSDYVRLRGDVSLFLVNADAPRDCMGFKPRQVLPSLPDDLFVEERLSHRST